MVITRQTKIGQLIRQHPQAKAFLLMNGLHCAGCAANEFDTIESGGRIHRWPEQEIDLLVEELNKYLNETKFEARSTKSETNSNVQNLKF